ncbi:MAG TPA: hypothetical protein VL947_03660 [Cytophagales bacterium]|nr:hypothetical protein [Cytophagales bacterium]
MKKITFLLASLGVFAIAVAQDSTQSQQVERKAIDKSVPAIKKVEKPATHPDGIQNYFKKKFIYPPRTNFTGNVVVNYIVEFDGTLSDITVVTPCPDKIKQEVIRVFKESSGAWHPAWHEGQMVRQLAATQVKVATP